MQGDFDHGHLAILAPQRRSIETTLGDIFSHLRRVFLLECDAGKPIIYYEKRPSRHKMSILSDEASGTVECLQMVHTLPWYAPGSTPSVTSLVTVHVISARHACQQRL